MSNDTDAAVAAMRAIGEGVTEAVENASAKIASFGVEFSRAYEQVVREQAEWIAKAMSIR